MTALIVAILGSVSIAGVLVLRGESLRSAFSATGLTEMRCLRWYGYDDSWGMMLAAYQKKTANPSTDMYKIFFEDHAKFQYPPSSLLLLDLFPRSITRSMDSQTGGRTLARRLLWVSAAAVLLTLVVSSLILKTGFERWYGKQAGGSFRLDCLRLALSLALGLLYYPVMVAQEGSQIQVYLNFFAGLAILMSFYGRKALSGACIGLCCLVKPQYGIVLLWFVLRRDWKFLRGFLSIFLPGTAVAIARFGLRDHFRYLDVLKTISRQGETYWSNQSANGLLNRFLGNGDPTYFGNTFSSYHPVVYGLTLLSSLMVLALALWPRGSADHPKDSSGGVVDLAIVLAAATLASPIAWNHHYGVFFPIFAVALPPLMSFRPAGKWTAFLLALSYVMMADVMLRPNVIFSNRWTGLAGSHLLYGAFILFGLLLAFRAKMIRSS